MAPVPLRPPTWEQTRKIWVEQAVQERDLGALRKIGGLPGGFAGERKRVWPIILRLDSSVSEKSNVEASDVNAEASTSEGQTTSIKSADDLAQGSGNALEGNSKRSPEVLTHKDEQQVKLDTDRSFVTYPTDISPETKKELQDDLENLIVGVLRKYPALSYFQGFHDILSVFYLNYFPPKPIPTGRERSMSRRLEREQARSRSRSRYQSQSQSQSSSMMDLPGLLTPAKTPPPLTMTPPENAIVDPDLRERDTEEWRELRKCVEVLCLTRVRDAMGSGMEGMMGLLKLLQNLLSHADPSLYNLTSSISPSGPLPFFALSWVLTLFSHDVDDLETISRIFDWGLGRDPSWVVYLSAAVLITNKPQLLSLISQLPQEYTDDTSLLHPLFSRLPPLHPDTPTSASPTAPKESKKEKLKKTLEWFHDPSLPSPYDPIPLSKVFKLGDELMERLPWDGEAVRGKDVFGPGSVLVSYKEEQADGGHWSAEECLARIDVDVILPGALDPQEEEDEKPRRGRIVRQPGFREVLTRIQPSTLVAFGVLALGVGIAFYGVKGEGRGWRGWWGLGRAVWEEYRY
ncbi:hypothetical protein L198_05966 [Cryptococcus wingfieldii CBS 7118]|uniref:Rab-GAP TBC domain-containing protein n=1 Tax=Cryptococcus wingfieldii CBS 7118 TaxID=1295528 RepID=A0A1E3IS65_9TREE|nr:hypothetical protein L198_05966 [Cryptococcus wingfieldii CBS 7118]ODN91450.1 hypothetical protein L198_05966 [Cryptococcus wingfieldii CBS 7118]